ncbi:MULTISPECIES: hypothetical protein [Paraburkholderia]|uniref:hypothetical protein n=1 Tax=Paraburkholderia TaxID=1822464 RepID=UPI00224D4023|nr:MULTISPECIES: hypothetical protein [Paraburkholderia]MCX4175670.1 hypothetical protein [Paraburkholderia madseniana]MDQ6463665.1 hypothetical protein [Paraburkholderia madseniana]
MPFIAIDTIRTDQNRPDGLSHVNPDHVSAVAQPRENPQGWTHIFLDALDDSGGARSLTTARELQHVLARFGPFVEIRRLEIQTGDNWPVWHVRVAAIVALVPAGEGRGRLFLKNRADLWVNYADVATSLAKSSAT